MNCVLCGCKRVKKSFSSFFRLGSPRGYCFVTYHKEESAMQAIKSLNGVLIKEKRLAVRLANTVTKTEPKTSSSSTSNTTTQSKKSQIAALEAKLKSIEPQDASAIKQRLSHSTKTVSKPPGTKAKIDSNCSTSRYRHKPYDYRK